MADSGDTSRRLVDSVADRARELWRLMLGDRPVARMAIMIVAVGCLLRALHFFGGRSLWLDEAMVADSIVHRDWTGLLSPLSYNQVAPLGWLMVERASYVLLGGSDLSLRAPSLLAGIAALLLFAHLAKRSFSSHAFLLACATFALSSTLVRFSAEVKPYGVDVLVSVAALSLAFAYLQQGRSMQLRDHVLLLVVGLVSVFLSFPAAFVLAGLGGALFLREVVKRRWAQAAWIAIVSSAWLSAFLWLLLRTRQGASANVTEITASWSGAYAPALSSLSGLKWYAKALLDVLRYMFGPESMAAWLLAIAIGAVLTIRSRFYLGVALLAPLLAALVASGLHLYPFSDRLLLFAFPELVFLAFVGVEAAISLVKTPVAGALVAAALLLCAPLIRLWGEFTYYPAPFGTEHVLGVMRGMATRTDVDAVYASGNGLPAFRYYRERAGLAGVPLIAAPGYQSSLGCVLGDVELVSRNRRIWVFFSHAGRVLGDIPDDVAFSYFADAAGRRVQSIDVISVHAYLYEFDAESTRRVSAIRHALGSAGDCPGAGRSEVE